MKKQILISIILLSSVSNACNQKVYDIVYSKILDESLQHNLTRNEQNMSIEWLRKLCDDRTRSRWEIGDSKGLHEKELCVRMSPRTVVYEKYEK